MLGQRGRVLHQQRGIGANARTIASAKEPADGLAGCLSEQVPQGDVDPADGVGDRSAAALPERVLMKFFADSLRLQRGLAAVERFEQLQARGPANRW